MKEPDDLKNVLFAFKLAIGLCCCAVVLCSLISWFAALYLIPKVVVGEIDKYFADYTITN